jgi:ABC-type antimicrobial peptide transport system permease subunit
LAGAITGLALGWLLVFVINVQSFGWTLLWSVPLESILWFGILLALVGAASGVVSASYWNFRRR